MKQVALNLMVSIFILAAVFFVASQGTSSASATALQVPSIVIDGVSGGRLQLHGSGFRPGSLVSLQLQHESLSGTPVANADTWVDQNGAFAADLDVQQFVPQLASLNGSGVSTWDDLIVLATASNASLTVPVMAAVVQVH